MNVNIETLMANCDSWNVNGELLISSNANCEILMMNKLSLLKYES